MTASSSSSVRVAVRVRPLTDNEKQHFQHNAIKFIPNNQQQIVLDGDRSFTFDYVYPPTANQNDVYSTCVIPLLNKFMEGYNSTILAYGQTGSGKTYSMGIGLDSVMNAVNEGIVPRFIHSLFQGLNAKKSPNYSFQVCVSFLELHNEDLVDLLCPSAVKRSGYVSNLTIREDSQGNICWSGVKEEVVTSPNELMGFLQKGSIARTTASTDMNNTSSRSHAIFSVILKQEYIISSDTDESVGDPTTNKIHRSPSDQTLVSNSSTPHVKKLSSKFHFVDLAGSERLKRTNAVGDRAKEGISINTGLLALGNVISALGDESRRVSHIPYRDSKLTRLLQDSLGGNSQTLMLACASPSDSNITETLNTLKYANRARNIRNRVIINQEVGEAERLKATITRLKEELRGTDDFLRAVNDEMDSLKNQVGSLHQALNQATEELAMTKYERDTFKHQLNDDGSETTVSEIGNSLVREYAKTIELLRIELLESQQQQNIHPTAKPLFVDQKNSTLQIDHVDSSTTLVASPTHSKSYFDNPEKNDRKKKKHSYRFGSKRLKSQRRRSITLLTSNSSNPSPKPVKSAADLHILNQARKTIERETEFLESAKISIASDSFWDNKDQDLMTGPKVLQYRRRTVDVIPPISVASALQTDHINENKRLLQKLSNMIESKHLVIRQLEKSEKLRTEQAQQLNRKIADLLSKKTSSSSQYKRELAETRSQYECRIKKQQVELQSLRRKHMQLMSKTDGMRNQNQSVIEQLNRTVEKLTHEKKKLIKRLKMESDRAREKHMESDREMAKLKRQEAQSVSAKKRMERELLQQKSATKRSTEEIVALGGQMKQIAAILKKVMSNGGKKKPNNSAITDRNLLAKAAACANVRGYLVKQSAIKKSGGKFQVTTLQQHVYQKKRLIHRAITLYVRGQSSNKIGEELIQKRDRLIQEQNELLTERNLVLEEETKKNLSIDATMPQYMDERIDLITVQVDTLNQQIIRLSEEKCTADSSDDDWMDVVDKELHIGMLDDTDSQVAYEIALSLIRSLEPEEARLVSESLMEDIVQLKTDQQHSTTSIKHLGSMLNSLQTGLVQMRRVGHDQQHANMDYFSRSANSALNSLFLKVLQSPVDIQCGLVLPKNESIC